MKTSMKTAVIQMEATSDKARNIQRAVSLVRQAIRDGAEFILLPEVFVYRGDVRRGEALRGIVEKIPGESTAPLMALAKKHKACILAGSIYEKAKEASKAYNTSVFINDQGVIQAVYRKIHLFEAIIRKRRIRESDQFIAGKRAVMTQAKGFKVGLSVCYDLRFPELYRGYARGGAEVLCVPSAFTRQTGQAHWEVLLRARAIENLCYVLAPNQTGKDARGIFCYGTSMIIDPWGKVLVRASADREEILYAYLDKGEVGSRRQQLPFAAGKEKRHAQN
ncbi:MAG: hypothetical protein A3D87_06245 [Omnitrophica WOR_2 bacterium RIFCSPHIGHO2_02_FULL_50_17]|nr:MAG: hypothetical protein A3D87_06245 [Omnitrophica WOR_2 bacterium RIFCSPHIGHO2_02_FULL_50_17]